VVDKKKAQDAVLVFNTRADAGAKTDAQIRLQIKTLRALLLERQQRRAASRHQAEGK
jgi:hypothetical protein